MRWAFAIGCHVSLGSFYCDKLLKRDAYLSLNHCNRSLQMMVYCYNGAEWLTLTACLTIALISCRKRELYILLRWLIAKTAVIAMSYALLIDLRAHCISLSYNQILSLLYGHCVSKSLYYNVSVACRQTSMSIQVMITSYSKFNSAVRTRQVT